ncbi:hypothetical protein [Microbulbifer sp. JMSA003]|uniref:hypothetical protein n=1 Tax=Microbulbifer sp. JMSA003 TaxID=3243369 RepID=UPI0040394C40
MMRILYLSLALFCSVTYAESKTDILKMFEHFTLSSAAAGKCIKPEKKVLNAFLANYEMVSIYALQEVMKRNPAMSKEKAREAMKVGGEKATQMVYTVIEKGGCESPKIQDLIKRFHVQAKWKP